MFTSSATQHGGQEATILTSIPTFLHHGMIIVGFPYSNTDLTLLDEVSGGTPYGASTISGSDNKRQPSERELGLARAQGRYVAQRSEEHTSELQSLMRTSYAVFCLKKT